jgi:hypothetical protein
MRVPFVFLLAAALTATADPKAVFAQAAPYNPYAVTQEPPPPPVAADGTLHWGTFYKSAAIQKSYERLWNLGACRGTNRAITEPVERNKIVIDNLPEADFQGTVRGTAGTLAGGLLAFSPGPASDPWVATLHPAGVSQLTVTGQAPANVLKPGMTVRLRASVDAKGRGLALVDEFEIVTPPAGFTPDEVRPNRSEAIVGTVVRIRGTTLMLHVDAGRIRRLSLTLASDAMATINASQFELIAPGDTIKVTGRLWSGEGSMGAGTIFASKVTVTKPPAGEPADAHPPADRLGVNRP